MDAKNKDLPSLVWLYLPPLAALLVLAADFLHWPEICRIMTQRDAEGGGLLELGTPLVLIVGIVAAAYALKHFSQIPQRRLVRGWIILWMLACFYFAGEEISWGQWLFGWETPEALLKYNDQGETNLHNISNFLDQIPRAFVEAFIFFCGLLAPLWRRLTRRALDAAGLWTWILPTHVVTVAAAIWAAAQLTDWSGVSMDCLFNDSELREFYIATFLCLYLLSIWHRARQLRHEAPHPRPPTNEKVI